jgi:outer membrane immunogenic protein
MLQGTPARHVSSPSDTIPSSVRFARPVTGQRRATVVYISRGETVMIHKVSVVSAMLVLLASGHASAQVWNGAYIGGYGGLAIGNADVTSTLPGPGDYFAASSVTSINENGVFELTPKQLLVGGQLGFNGQAGSAVFGIEADFGVMNFEETAAVTVEYPCCAGTNYTISQAIDTSWLLTVRPRVGVAAGNVLVYGTGGLAFTKLGYISTFEDTFDAAYADAVIDERRTGWTVGGGIEVLAGRVSFKGEYLLVDFGEILATSDNFELNGALEPSVTFDHVATFRTSILRGGINVRF